ncbi:hypothetical protein F511_42444 [Dorcoceras hygrometricum]|uniref:Uncharacterized protein n=1 Tax=Dorcoceras hygrometricum TaxID=472368 RepID=A0A2Z7A867_9LAMI|nr:hypothetical protein F511_42444 [Dorcoceras hygrometricum]
MREFRVTSCWFGKPVVEVERRRFIKLKRCVLSVAYGTSSEGLLFSSFSADDLSVFGGAEFPVSFSFDCYSFEAAERSWERIRSSGCWL